ncbi:hypothetical protein TYRP_008427 [Tyrophagus putrescentiae]|nr:hypothetical protein TYRP_008427 [Tyrophagus putrescentiae]
MNTFWQWQSLPLKKVEQKLPQLSGEVFTLEENDDGDKVAAERDEGCQRVDDDDGHVPGLRLITTFLAEMVVHTIKASRVDMAVGVDTVLQH